MTRRVTFLARLLLAASVLVSGCVHQKSKFHFCDSEDIDRYERVATDIEYPLVQQPANQRAASIPPPVTLDGPDPPRYRPISLEEAVRTALMNSRVMRELGVRVLQTPTAAQTIFGPAIRHTNPQTGVDAALSAFDASFGSSLFFEKNDRAVNNEFFGGGTRIFQQDLGVFEAEINKLTATGSGFTIRNITEFDSNNAEGNRFPSAWTTQFEGEFRQPLLQGAGIDFNRIAGPSRQPGEINGVLIARINTDISVADFELAVRRLVSDVEDAYWELYFAYRDLDAKIAARDRALETWRRIHTLFRTGRRGGEAEKEAQAREQYFRLQEEVQNALSGPLLERTETNTFRATGGVYATERQLRLMMGVPLADGFLLRPATEPPLAKVSFDWSEVRGEALARRAELRQQRWRVKRRELELVASRNFLKPRLDVVGRYRWRGFGQDLLDPDRSPERFDNAFQDLTTGDFQEWQLGVEFSAPFGHRQAHAGVRNAHLTLARERAVLAEQEREVIYDLSTAVAEKDRSYIVAQTNANRAIAAAQQLAALEAVYDEATANEKTRLLDLLLDAQRRLADAESRYYRSLVEYAFSIKNVHLQKGSLLEYNNVYLNEGPWPLKACQDAARRNALRCRAWCLENFVIHPKPVARPGPPPVEIRETPPGAEPYETVPAPAPESPERLPAPPSGNRFPGDQAPTQPAPGDAP